MSVSKQKPKGLGRGLDVLLAAHHTEDRLATLKISDIRPGRYQPRTHMDEAALAQLADSILAQGVIQPVVVREIGLGEYELIAGERRWRAARKAGLAEIPAVVRAVPDEAALAIALIENIQREQLNALEAKHTPAGQLLNIYYETADNWLRRHDMGLRIRGDQGRYEMTLKIAGRVVGGCQLHFAAKSTNGFNNPRIIGCDDNA